MVEVQIISFTNREIAEMIVKKQNLHEGLWGISIEFGLSAANVHTTPDPENLLPAAIIPVVKIGLQRFSTPNSLTVDAAVVNPE